MAEPSEVPSLPAAAARKRVVPRKPIVPRRKPEPASVALPARATTSNRPPKEGQQIDIEQVGRVLAILPGASMLVDSDSGQVLSASAQARALSLVRGGKIASPELTKMVSEVSAYGDVRHGEVSLRRTPRTGGRLDLLARVATVSGTYVLVTVEDLALARRIDEVRRDFVANVSHELKTPVGALSLLSEAVLSASDDPEAVRHFAGRMQLESSRLAHLVTDLVELSRLQSQNPTEYGEPVSIDRVISETADSMRMAAQAESIEIVIGGTNGMRVFGVESQLMTALRNLLANAIAYSAPHTRVAVVAGLSNDGIVEISVTDQGIGIPANEIDRIFERFYRIDQARSRATGGTGLGLSIVKHVVRNHGGNVSVWSVENEGSTFKLELPAYVDEPAQTPETDRVTEAE